MSIQLPKLDRALRRVDPKIYQKAYRAAINREIRRANTAGSKAVRTRYTIKAKDLKSAVTLRLLRGNDKSARLVVTGKRLSMAKFKAKQVASGVRVEIIKGQAKVRKHAFMATMKSGHVGVFWRAVLRGKSSHSRRPWSLPIYEGDTVSAPGMYKHDHVASAIRKSVTDNFPKTMKNRVTFYLGRAR